MSAPLLAPVRPPRHSPISGILLTSADVDSVIGLLHLREFQPLEIYCTHSVRRILTEENRIFRVLDRAKPAAQWWEPPIGTWFILRPHSSAPPKTALENAIECHLVPLGGAYPDYVSEELRRSLTPGEAVIGVVFREGGKQLFYAPALPPGLSNWKEWAQSSDVCLLDGTFWSENELIGVGASSKTATEIGHTALSAPSGLLREFPGSPKSRKVLIHINNTNPILDEESAENREARDAGWEIAYDGMQIDL